MAKTRNYVNNKDLTAAIVEYQKQCHAQEVQGLKVPSMPRYIGECIMAICNRLTKGFNFDFRDYTYRDEMVADAIERCIYAVRKFNASKSKAGAFSYLTTVAIHAQKKRIVDEKKQNYTKHKYFQARFMQQDLDGVSPNELSDKVITDFEESLRRKQEKQLTNKKPFVKIIQKKPVALKKVAKKSKGKRK